MKIDRAKEEKEFNEIAKAIAEKYFSGEDDDEFCLVRIRHYPNSKEVGTSGALGIAEPETILRAVHFLMINFMQHTNTSPANMLKVFTYLINVDSGDDLNIADYMDSSGDFVKDCIAKQRKELEGMKFESEEQRKEYIRKTLNDFMPDWCTQVTEFITEILEKPVGK